MVWKKKPLKLGILAYGWTFGIYDIAETLRTTPPFAREIERLGYSRFWVTEHHGPDEAWSPTEIVVAAVAQATERIRVGSAGVLLGAYNPLKVALDFKCLATLYPGRIDLGIGAAPAGPNHYGLSGTHFLDAKEKAASYWKKAQLLLDFLHGRDFKSGIYKGCRAYPEGKEKPNVWVLGLSPRTISMSKKLNTNYCHGLWLKTAAETDEEKKFFLDFKSSARKSKESTISVSVVCADTEKAAHKFFANFEKDKKEQPVIAGSPEQCRTELLRLQNEYQVNEIIIRCPIVDPNSRLKSFRLIADVCELGKNS